MTNTSHANYHLLDLSCAGGIVAGKANVARGEAAMSRVDFGFLWAFTAVAGGAAGGAALDLLFSPRGAFHDSLPLHVVGLVAGIVSGIFQSLLLARFVPRAWRWFLATSVGTFLIGATNAAATGTTFFPFQSFLTWLIGPALVVPLQWLVLRGHIRSAGSWFSLTWVAWVIGIGSIWIGFGLFGVNYGASVVHKGPPPIPWLGAWVCAFGGLVGGSIAAVNLAKFLRAPFPDERPVTNQQE